MKKLIFILLLGFINIQAQEIYATFTVKAKQEANLAFNIGGIVENTSVDIGDLVKKDQLLAQLKNQDIKSNLNLANIELKYAVKELNRQLKVKNVIGRSMLDKFFYKKEIAKAKVTQIKTTLEKTYLTAPFNGIITYKEIEKGDVVTGLNPKVVYKIISAHKRKLLLSFDSKYIQDVKVGDRFNYKINQNGKDLTAIISKIYPTIDTKTQKAKAEVIVEDLKVGLFGSGLISTRK